MNYQIPRNRKFLNYIHHFRGLAILFIVGVHTVIAIQWSNPVMKKIIISITNNGTILFVFIAGFLFYYLSHEKFSYLNYLRKKLLYVILPYILISVPAIIDKLFFDPGNHWWMNEFYFNLSVVEKILYMLITGRHSGALWFIPMIAIFYILSPVFIIYGRSNVSDYLTPIFCIATLFTFRFGYYANILVSFIHFFPVYMLGMWVCKFRKRFFEILTKTIWLFIVIYLVVTILETLEVIPFDQYRNYRDMGYSIYTLNLSKLKAIILCFILLIIFHAYDHIKFPLLNILGDYSFGIYFLHIYLINITEKLSEHDLFFSSLNLWKYIIYTLLIILINIVIIRIIKSVFIRHSRMIIGS